MSMVSGSFYLAGVGARTRVDLEREFFLLFKLLFPLRPFYPCLLLTDVCRDGGIGELKKSLLILDGSTMFDSFSSISFWMFEFFGRLLRLKFWSCCA
mgnify:CR=1 FL=1